MGKGRRTDMRITITKQLGFSRALELYVITYNILTGSDQAL